MALLKSQVDLLKSKLIPGTSVVLVPHKGPDGDAMGSVLALRLFLSGMGVNASVIVPDEYPDFLAWLPGNESVINYYFNRKKAAGIISDAEIIFHIDHNDVERTGQMSEDLKKSSALRVLLDHHRDAILKPDISLYDPDSSATAELVYYLITDMVGIDAIDKDIATCIFTGIMTDTGCFSYNSSYPELYSVVEALLLKGIDKDYIYGKVYDNFSADRMRLLGDCLRRMEVLPEYNTAIMSLSLEEQKTFSFVTGDAEGFVNYPLSIKDIKFSVFFTEKENCIRISFRSRGSFAVNDFAAKYFNGGGHVNAAGGESSLSLPEAVAYFKKCLEIN